MSNFYLETQYGNIRLPQRVKVTVCFCVVMQQLLTNQTLLKQIRRPLPVVVSATRAPTQGQENPAPGEQQNKTEA